MNQQKVTIRLPNQEYPYLDCIIEKGGLDKLGEELFVFTTISRAGKKRRISIYPNNVITEVEIEVKPEAPIL